MGHPFLAPNEGTASPCQPNPMLDYVGTLPRPVPTFPTKEDDQHFKVLTGNFLTRVNGASYVS
jgi:hypothetical protein